MGAVNGSHVGLVELLNKRVEQLDSYSISCRPHGNGDGSVAVLIVAQLLPNDGMSVSTCVLYRTVGGHYIDRNYLCKRLVEI